MPQSTPTDSRFDRFLFAPLHDDGEAPLSVLSALARQDVDAWLEAARLAQLPKDHAVNSLASTIWKLDSERWSPSEASITAARLIELLPSHNGPREAPVPTDSSNRMMMWLIYGLLYGSIAMSGTFNQQSEKNSSLPNQASSVVGQQEAASRTLSEASRD